MALCACGCGQEAGLAKEETRGYTSGQPLKYVKNHNARWMVNRDLKTRLFSRRRIEGECWVWTGQIDKRGYGRMSYESRKQFVHNLSYRLFVGPIVDGHEPDHLCKNRACFNPDHLESVTQAENCRRGRQAKLTHEDVALIRSLNEPHSVTARRFGLHDSTICDIRNFKRWNYGGRSS